MACAASGGPRHTPGMFNIAVEFSVALASKQDPLSRFSIVQCGRVAGLRQSGLWVPSMWRALLHSGAYRRPHASASWALTMEHRPGVGAPIGSLRGRLGDGGSRSAPASVNQYQFLYIIIMSLFYCRSRLGPVFFRLTHPTLPATWHESRSHSSSPDAAPFRI